jgi:hypothetical protein
MIDVRFGSLADIPDFRTTSALSPETDVRGHDWNIRFGLEADIKRHFFLRLPCPQAEIRFAIDSSGDTVRAATWEDAN